MTIRDQIHPKVCTVCAGMLAKQSIHPASITRHLQLYVSNVRCHSLCETLHENGLVEDAQLSQSCKIHRPIVAS